MADDDTKKTNKKDNSKTHDSKKYIETEPTMNEEEMDIYLEGLDDDDLLSHFDSLDEAPLNIAQRRKRAMIMRKFKSKIVAARARSKKRKASPEKLKLRARKTARNMIRQRLMKNKSYSEMTPSEKVALDKRLARVPKAAIDRIATRQLPIVRKAEVERLSKLRSTKKESLDNRFEDFLYEASLADTNIKKRYHMALEKDNSVKFDNRFKIFSKKNSEQTESIAESEKLCEMVEAYENYLFGESIDYQNLDEQTILDKVISAVHKHVLKGTNLYDIAYEISGAAGVSVGPREIMNMYIKKFGDPNIKEPKDHSALKGKYGFKENNSTPSQREYGTDSLVRILKKDTPYQNESALNSMIRRGMNVAFEQPSIIGQPISTKGIFVGTDAKTGRMRIRERDGKLHIVKHEYVEAILESRSVMGLKEYSMSLPKAKDTLGIKRDKMPQVSSKDMDDFKNYLKSNNVSIDKKIADPSKLMASQKEFDADKVADKMAKMNKSNVEPKAIIISSDNYVIDGHHRWLAAKNLGIKIPALKATMKAKELIKLINKYPKVKNVGINESGLYEAFSEINENDSCTVLTMAQMREFEKLVDKLFAKFKIDFDFTKHFRERMSDERNSPCITMRELAAMIKKIYDLNKADSKSLTKFTDTEAVIKDMQSNLNMPIAVEYDRSKDELRVVAKTIMRKKDFRTPNTIVRV
jgi:hypothetical protein